MQINYNNERAFYGDLEEVFSRALSAAELRRLYSSFFYDVKKQTESRKKLIKSEMVKAFLELAENPEDSRLFMETLPQDVYRAYELLLWRDFMVADEAQNALVFDFILEEPTQRHWARESYSVRREYPFIALLRGPNYSYSRDKSPLTNYLVSIPPALRKWLKTYFPKPEGYHIKPLPESDIDRREYAVFDASSTIASDLGQLADFLKRGAVKRTQKGDPTKASIRKAESITEAGEWYPEEDKKSELTLMRHTMLLDFIEGFEGGLMNKLTAPEIEKTVFKDLLKALRKDEEMITKWLMGHLQKRYKYSDETLRPKALSGLFSLFEQLSPEAWFSMEHLKLMRFYQEIDVLLFDPGSYHFDAALAQNNYRYCTTHSLDPTYLKPVGIDPLIDGMAFLLSAFGLVELAYTPPRNEVFRTYKNLYLTPFDGAHAVRLTDVGAYAFGHSSELTLKQSSRKVATLRLHPEQLHVTCRNIDPVTELALKEFMEAVTPEFYRMTRTSILKGCQSPKDVKQRVADFRKRIGVELPENWQQFLAAIEAEKSALVSENDFKIFTLANRPDLQRHFTQNPILRKLTLRVEGHRIAVAKENVPLVQTHLRKLGYMV